MNNLKNSQANAQEQSRKKSVICGRSTTNDKVGALVQEKLDRVVSSLEESKGEDIRTIDLRGRSPLADFMVIASGRSQRHVSALADHLLTAMKVKNAGNIRVEGLTEGNWVLIDCGDIIVHLFRPEAREFYNLEKIWIIPDIEAPVVKGAGAN